MFMWHADEEYTGDLCLKFVKFMLQNAHLHFVFHHGNVLSGKS